MKIFFSALLFLFVLGSCSKETSIDQMQQSKDSLGSSNPTDTGYFYSFEVDSTIFYEQAFINGYQLQYYSSTNHVTGSIAPASQLGIGGCCAEVMIWDTTGFSESIALNNNPDSGATLALFHSLLSPGNFKYGSNPVNGIVIAWVDNYGKLWTTIAGNGDQTGSQFTINSSKQSYPTNGMIVNASFNCRLYDSAGNPKVITNGRTRLLFLSGLFR